MNAVLTIDLNVDFGESENTVLSPTEAAILATASSINLSCGVHAGSVALIRAILREAASFPIAIGAHPSYDDRTNFGRRETGLAATAIEPLVSAQVLGLMALALESGTRIRYIKAHGALYHRTARDAEAAAALCRVARGTGPRLLPLLGPADSILESTAKRTGVPFYREGLLDRGYRADGTLVPRDQPGAMITDSVEVSARAVAIARGEPIATVDGPPVKVAADSICIHGDSDLALTHLRAVRDALRTAGVDVLPFAP